MKLDMELRGSQDGTSRPGKVLVLARHQDGTGRGRCKFQIFPYIFGDEEELFQVVLRSPDGADQSEVLRYVSISAD